MYQFLGHYYANFYYDFGVCMSVCLSLCLCMYDLYMDVHLNGDQRLTSGVKCLQLLSIFLRQAL